MKKRLLSLLSAAVFAFSGVSAMPAEVFAVQAEDNTEYGDASTCIFPDSAKLNQLHLYKTA